MTNAQKRKFIRDLIRSCQHQLLTKVPETPESWDGIELRQWIADYFADQCAARSMRAGLTAADRKRHREYKNDVLVRNLI